MPSPFLLLPILLLDIDPTFFEVAFLHSIIAHDHTSSTVYILCNSVPNSCYSFFSYNIVSNFEHLPDESKNTFPMTSVNVEIVLIVAPHKSKILFRFYGVKSWKRSYGKQYLPVR
jgi:hypothetical protein